MSDKAERGGGVGRVCDPPPHRGGFVWRPWLLLADQITRYSAVFDEITVPGLELRWKEQRQQILSIFNSHIM